MNYRECYEEGLRILNAAGIEESSLDARLLLEHLCHTRRHDLLVHGDQPVTEEKVREYLELIGKRAGHIPLQHLTGTQDFMGLTFRVSENVLIPRQDTEILVEEVLKELHDGMTVLDMCTGSGCILISLLHYSNDCTGTGADVSEAALEVARFNGEALLDEEKRSRLSWIRTDLFENVSGRYDRIVSNPPYISSAVIETLMPEVRDHEPRMALDGCGDGLLFYRRIVSESRDHLVRGGMLYFEIGYDQAGAVCGLMRENGYTDVFTVHDYAGLDRVVCGTYVG